LLRWHWKFTIRRGEYGDEEKGYLIRKKLGLSSIQWDAMEPARKDVLFARKLWIDANFQVSFVFDEEHIYCNDKAAVVDVSFL